MVPRVLSVHEGLGTSRRFPLSAGQGSRATPLELGILASCGLVAAIVSAYGKDGFGLPGHNILRILFPMAMGMAMVPRQGAGSVMGLSGLAGATILTQFHFGPLGMGMGAAAGLFFLGLFLDLAMLGARDGRAVYLRFIAAGLAANLVAMLARGAMKLWEGDALGLWWPRALVSYPLCGLLVGVVSAVVWFRVTARPKEPS
jgi:hypothetical protein